MRLIPLTTIAGSVLAGALFGAAALVMASAPAEAQGRSRADVERNEAYPGDRSYRRAQDRRSRGNRTRITVRPRNYLNAGTMVLPHSQPYLDYAIPPMWTPSQIYDPTGSFRSPLPGSFPGSGWLP